MSSRAIYFLRRLLRKTAHHPLTAKKRSSKFHLKKIKYMSVNRIFNVLLLYLGVLGLREGDNAVNKTPSKIVRGSYDQAPNDSVT